MKLSSFWTSYLLQAKTRMPSLQRFICIEAVAI
jgi:hypothetical protein